MGFCVAKTVKFSGSGMVWRSMVTMRSCIAWSRADWVLAGARLISSASRNVVNTSPLTSLKVRPARSKTLVPVMSLGMRCGGTWTMRRSKRRNRKWRKSGENTEGPGNWER